MNTRAEITLGCSAQTSCITCPDRHRSLCASCEPDELRQVEAIRFFRVYEPGQTIAWETDLLDFVGTIVSGVVSLTKIMADGRTQVVAMLRPGNLLGHPYSPQISYNAIASTSVMLCGFHREPFKKLLDQIPALGRSLLEQSSRELDASREWILLLGSKNAREKVASFLAICARPRIEKDPSLVKKQMSLVLPFTRAEMGSYLSLTLETVSRQFSALKDDDIILPRGKRGVVIMNYPALLAETGDDADGGWLA